MKAMEFIQYLISAWLLKGKHKSGSLVCLSQFVLYWKHKVLA